MNNKKESFQFECKNPDEIASNNMTSGVIDPDTSKLGCVATPWVRLFSRYLYAVDSPVQ